ncbi:hypothetical protein GP486_000968 [Trichoglossum hirsutum]|uniref:von Willebrand and RING finger domain protein n=1 Tax=Trichoglossum hirsutum TaxID=265104 RepID=A0A9P8RT54_9PEZI|nr:hypothetical protein GP486_000968 [Trichoglossum hirsutum]
MSRRSNPNSIRERDPSSSSNWYRFGLRGRRGKPRDTIAEEEETFEDTPSPTHSTGRLRHQASDPNLADRSGSSASLRPNGNSYQPSRLRPATGGTYARSWQGERPTYSSHSETSLGRKKVAAMAGMLDLERSRTRRERTFVGGVCAVCEEPLEHTLRGERILQFSCGHISHEACFYEYIKEFESQYCPTCNAPLGLDTSRGGNVLDLVSISDARESTRESQSTPTPWDGQSISRDRSARDLASPDPQRDGRERIERLGRQHYRNGSSATGAASSDYAQSVNGRRHDYDVQSMEADLSVQHGAAKNPIPSPTVVVRSEFPTLNRSRQQQSLTCLVTVEVPEGLWKPDPEDLRSSPQAQPLSRDDGFQRPRSESPKKPSSPDQPSETLDAITEDLRVRVENWHGLDFQRFGRLRLYGTVKVGKDRQSWQELECYLFSEMLICVKEKKITPPPNWDEASKKKASKCTLKGSILIKKHLKQVIESASQDEHILTLSLSVAELPSFHLQFPNRGQLGQWRRALLDLNASEAPAAVAYPNYETTETSETDEDDYRTLKTTRRVSSVNSAYGANRSTNTAPTEYTNSAGTHRLPSAFHVPLDIVVVIPVSSSMQGLKITLLRDALRFLVQNLGNRDRMGLVTFGSSGGGVPLVGMTTKTWSGWSNVLSSIRPVGQKSLRADVVEGANVAMDLLMQRKSNNPIATILLISDSSTSDGDSVDFVVSRAEAAKVTIHSFGLGLTHKPDTMIELSTRTKASYTYVKDWMMLRECVAGCLGSLQTLSHQNAKLRLKLPEGSPAKFVKISGALQITKRATGRDAEATLGDLRFGDKRGSRSIKVCVDLANQVADILVQLVIAPDNSSQEQLPQDPWESIVSGLEALGGPLDQDEQRVISVEEVPLIQADLTYCDILRDGTLTHLPRPSLLAITMLPAQAKRKQTDRPSTPPIPPHPSVVQRRMELLTSDMLTRALTLVSRGQHERAHHLLAETRSILKGLGKGGLPPIPPTPTKSPSLNSALSSNGTPPPSATGTSPERRRTPSPHSETNYTPAAGIDVSTVSGLDAEIESALEWINHPAVFGRDSRKAVLQAIGVISSQRAYTFRTPTESLWAARVAGIKELSAKSREWREADDALLEET